MKSDAHMFPVNGSSALQANEGPSSKAAQHVISFADAARMFGPAGEGRAVVAADPVLEDAKAFLLDDPLGVRALAAGAKGGLRSGALQGSVPRPVAAWKVVLAAALFMAAGLASILLAV